MKLFSIFIIFILLFSRSFAQNTWHTQNSGTNKFLTGIYFTDENTGWITGWTGTILHTTDGGLNWIDQGAPPVNAYYDIYFVDDQTGWAVGYGGRVVHTTDGGANWNIQATPTQYSISDLHFVNSTTGWAVGGKARTFTDPIREILFTDDGGNSWTRQLFESGKEPLSSVFFIDETNGFAVGEFSAILHTGDGGSTWQEQMYGTGYHFNDVYFINPDTGWVVGEDLSLQHYAVIFNTTDGGATWNMQSFNSDETLEGVYFNNDSTGYAVGGSNTVGRILKTTDGGATWNTEVSNTANFLTTVFFVDENSAWAVGYDGTIITTHSPTVSISNGNGGIQSLPETVHLDNNYPNPFNPQTTIGFQLPQNSSVTLKIYSITGQLVKTLLNETVPAGYHSVVWDGTNNFGNQVGSGIYLYQLKSGEVVQTRKMHLLK